MEVAPALVRLYEKANAQSVVNQFKSTKLKDLEVLKAFRADLEALNIAFKNTKFPFRYEPKIGKVLKHTENTYLVNSANELMHYTLFMLKICLTVSRATHLTETNAIHEIRSKTIKSIKRNNKTKKEFEKGTENAAKEYANIMSAYELLNSLEDKLNPLLLKLSPATKNLEQSLRINYFVDSKQLKVLRNNKPLTKSHQPLMDEISKKYKLIRERHLDPNGSIEDKVKQCVNIRLELIRQAKVNNSIKDFYDTAFIVEHTKYEEIKEAVHALLTETLGEIDSALELDAVSKRAIKEAARNANPAKAKGKEKPQTPASSTKKSTSSNDHERETVNSNDEDLYQEVVKSFPTSTSLSNKDDNPEDNSDNLSEKPCSSTIIKLQPEQGKLSKPAVGLSLPPAKEGEPSKKSTKSQGVVVAPLQPKQSNTGQSKPALTFRLKSSSLTKFIKKPGVDVSWLKQIRDGLKNKREKFDLLFGNNLQKAFTIKELDGLIEAAGGKVDRTKSGSRKKITLCSQRSDMIAPVRETLHDPHAKSKKVDKHASVPTVKLYRSIFIRAGVTPKAFKSLDCAQDTDSSRTLKPSFKPKRK